MLSGHHWKQRDPGLLHVTLPRSVSTLFPGASPASLGPGFSLALKVLWSSHTKPWPVAAALSVVWQPTSFAPGEPLRVHVCRSRTGAPSRTELQPREDVSLPAHPLSDVPAGASAGRLP